MPVLPQLADPTTYNPHSWDLLADKTQRDYWLDLFRRHFVTLLTEAQREAADRGAPKPPLDEATQQFFAWLDQAHTEPVLNVMHICLVREEILRELGFEDPYRLAKQEQNDAALKVLPALLNELDGMNPMDREMAVVRGVFAGNIFDLGAPETVAMFGGGQTVDFDAIRGRLKARPWCVDHLDAWLARRAHTLETGGPSHQRALLFVDNAGPDIVLGMIPLARHLLSTGTQVVLTSNSEPSLNDIIHSELVPMIQTIAGFDPVIGHALTSGALMLVPSGNGAPLIDLSQISPELAAQASAGQDHVEADLVVLEGMGRAVESNFHASLSCDTLKIAMLKDAGVARWLQGEPFDLVFRFDPADGG